ncbi:MAG: RIP metalloprotease RseP [Beijerinckiaceae bacterium]|nr:RIP metalloprotease RseP [Beijerinckiaceae bacterium]
MTVLAHFESIVTYTLPFLFVLTLVVFIHELGHFLVGRWCGIKVDAFSLGFGPELLHYIDSKGTRWRLAALPLGGYVKFHGDANGASMADEDQIEAMPENEKAVTFFGQPVWKRAAVVVAGPVANFILAMVVFSGLFFINGREVLSPQVGVVRPGSAAEAAGFQPLDLVVEINGQPVKSFEQMQRAVQSSDGPMTFAVQRADKVVTLTATPRREILKTRFGETRVGILGVEAANTPASWHKETYGLTDSVEMGASETWFIVTSTGNYLRGVVLGRESADQISGPIRIAEVSGEMAKLGFAALLNLAAILSVSIGLLNLLPIPLLDGGHLLYYAFEALRGRALGGRTQQFGFRVGITFVAALTIFAAYNDISRLVRQVIH